MSRHPEAAESGDRTAYQSGFGNTLSGEAYESIRGTMALMFETRHPSLNETHDVALRSWVQSATDSDADFPIQNQPPAAFRPRGQGAFRIGAAWLVGIGLGSATSRVLPADVRG